jgi:lipopolysaccharide assembly outer membrane protein LptD (OstA)
LDLINVKGKITSEKRDTIYIVSDFAQYNSVNLNSKFYKNVIINYQDKEITCVNFDIDMETNKAMAYNDVLITDPKSKMKAGIVEFDLKTKDININPESAIEKIEVVTN